MSDKQSKMLGVAAGDPHKNTANCRKVNDRDRRRRKRMEKSELAAGIKSGVLLASVLTGGVK